MNFLLFITTLITFFMKNITCLHYQNHKYLTNTQISKINSIFLHPGVTTEMKNKIYDRVFEMYDKVAIKKTILFKEKYEPNMKNSKLDELYQYSLLGLWYAIMDYDPSLNNNETYNLHSFIVDNIDDSLYKGYIQLQTMEGVYFQ